MEPPKTGGRVLDAQLTTPFACYYYLLFCIAATSAVPKCDPFWFRHSPQQRLWKFKAGIVILLLGVGKGSKVKCRGVGHRLSR